MALCLLSRRLHFLVFLKLLTSLQLAKAMISLVPVSDLLQLFSLTSQPTCQKPHFCKQLSYLYSTHFEHCISHVPRRPISKRNASFFESAGMFSYVQLALRFAASRLRILRHQIAARFDSLSSTSQLLVAHACGSSDVLHDQFLGIHTRSLTAAIRARLSGYFRSSTNRSLR
jgi:hypothetical protein